MTLEVSRLLDGQLDPGETAHAVDKTAGDPALRDRLTVYQWAGDALRGNATADDGFTLRILQRMERERVRIEPGYDPLAEE